jgi:hypothetical protein
MIAANGQVRISNIYLGLGYQDSKLVELNNSVYNYDLYLSDHFYKVKGFNNIIAGFETKIKKRPRISFDLSVSYLFSFKQMNEFITFKEYTGFIIDPESGAWEMPPINTASYNFGFNINTYIIEFVPQYELMTREKTYLNFGVGPNFYFTSLKQKGINFETSLKRIRTEQSSRTYTKSSFSWLSNIEFGYNIFDNIFIELMIKYRFGVINGIGAKNTILYEGNVSNDSELYPITKTKIDYSGLNYMINLKYRL